MQGILGGFRGKVGSVVGYCWRGRAVVRGYRAEVRYPNTARQRAERDWFVAMVRMAAAVRPALLLGLRERAAHEQMTEGNWFVRCNKPHFTTAADGGVAVDYARLRLSEGPVAGVATAVASVSGEGVLSVGWARRGGVRRERSADGVRCFVYNATRGCGLMVQEARRGDGALACRLPDRWQADSLHCYLFAIDAAGHASPTAYVQAAPEAVGEPSAPVACALPRPVPGQAAVGEGEPAPVAALPAPGREAHPDALARAAAHG